MARRYIRWVPSPRLMKTIGRVHAFLYRATRGVVGGHMDGLDILLLHTRGRRSGEWRCVPVPYFESGRDLLLIASFGGNDRHPAWYLNLRAHPEVELQVGGRKLGSRAETATGEERARLWQQVIDDQPRYADYQRKTSREIPVVVLRGAAR